MKKTFWQIISKTYVVYLWTQDLKHSSFHQKKKMHKTFDLARYTVNSRRTCCFMSRETSIKTSVRWGGGEYCTNKDVTIYISLTGKNFKSPFSKDRLRILLKTSIRGGGDFAVYVFSFPGCTKIERVMLVQTHVDGEKNGRFFFFFFPKSSNLYREVRKAIPYEDKTKKKHFCKRTVQRRLNFLHR